MNMISFTLHFLIQLYLANKLTVRYYLNTVRFTV